MEMTTFGSALKFAIDLENMAMKVFADAAETAGSEESKGSFLEFSASSRTRRLLLEKQYSENVYSDMDTGIFEPLPVMYGEKYSTCPEPSVDGGTSAFLREVIAMEERISSFYLDFASRMKTRRRGVAKTYDKMAMENFDRIKRLTELNLKISAPSS
jgi:rubrerythrin